MRDDMLVGVGRTLDPAARAGMAGDIADLAVAYSEVGAGDAATSTAQAIARLFGDSKEPSATDALQRTATYRAGG